MTFVVSEGTVASLDRSQARLPTNVRLAEDYAPDYAQLWRTQPSVRTVVSFLARNVAQLGLHTFERVSDTDRKRLTDHPVAHLISRPNSRTTQYRLWDALMHDLGIFDRAYWWKVRGAEDALQVHRLFPAQVTPKGESWLGPDLFEVRGSRGKTDIPADQVVHFRGFAPDSNLEGTSPIESLRQILAEEWEAGRYREASLKNGARVSGYLSRPVGAPNWQGPARENFRASWQAQYAGGGGALGGTPILEDGMTFVPASQTAEQLEYVSARKLTREEVAAAYFIPPPMVGLLEHATFSNIAEQHKMLYQDTLGPWLELISQEIDLQLLPEFGAAGQVYVEFNLDAKLKGSFEEQAQQLQSSVGGPWVTRNEARARANLPAIDGGDDLITPLNVVIGGVGATGGATP